jgi:hypothetical protein
MTIEEMLHELQMWAAEGALGWHEANAMEEDIRKGIQTLRDRIDELGGYHDDV